MHFLPGLLLGSGLYPNAQVYTVRKIERDMDNNTREQLQKAVESGSGTYQETAQALLSGELNWPAAEIALFIDSFINEPYLTRND